MPTLLVTGANRGIGLEFARQYSKGGWDVIAAARQSSVELEALGVRVELLDLTDADAVAAFPSGLPGELDLFIANAGTNHPMDPQGPQNARDWQLMMMINAIAPYQLGKSLLSRMSGGGKIIAISSGLGSIAENNGGWQPYRTSKAALNMAWTTLAIEAQQRRIPVVLLSPGWVKTRMGGAGAEITSEESVADMRSLIDRLTMSDSGSFLRRDGSRIPW